MDDVMSDEHQWIVGGGVVRYPALWRENGTLGLRIPPRSMKIEFHSRAQLRIYDGT
jgi:hypothetical protein